MSLLGNFAGGASGLLFTRGGRTDISAIYTFIGAALLFGMIGTVSFAQEPRVKLNPPPFRLGEFFRGLLSTPARPRLSLGCLDAAADGDGRLHGAGVPAVLHAGCGAGLHAFREPRGRECRVGGVLFLLALLAGAVASTLVAGVLSDRLGRKPMVYVSSVLQAVPPLAFVFFGRFDLVVGLGIVFGLGYGAYQAVDWALASDTISAETNHAHDMGVWHVAITLPQVIATPIAGFLLDKFQAAGRQQGVAHLGYTVIFLLAVVYFVLGTVLVRRIRNVR